MKKLRFLLFDANVVFYLHELGIWDSVVDRCEVTLSRVVAEHEIRYFRGKSADQIIDLASYIADGRVLVVDATPTEVSLFAGQFSDEYLEKLDPGESESLCYLAKCGDPMQICSSDAIVFRVLGALNRTEQGLSLEELFQKIGLSQGQLLSQYTKAFRLQYTRTGQRDLLQNRALR